MVAQNDVTFVVWPFGRVSFTGEEAKVCWFVLSFEGQQEDPE